ncbi:MAG: DUF4058 family protein [Chloroflexi bacterium]|nr:DUF4058 family protein [Chloroflexota bacterium]MCI0579390.1 DUF4058 family protein [Chloroflexota bacterium]MCI0643784.1 DUF4058 family protein [Chloroflexota bacterium]MCI0730028.1 DUF4058 family protein [Chloroflexota bacterium]
MPSPFPRMDPYLEAADMWEDFQANLAMEIQAQLTPYLRPRYIAALTPRVVYDEVVIARPYTIKPEVSVWKVHDRPQVGVATAISPPPLVGTVSLEEPVREQRIEIHEVETKRLVTVLEILSPVNKRRGHDAFESYRRKRRHLLRTEVHLMEIDLLRVGERASIATPLPDEPYFIFLYRGPQPSRVEIWPLPLQKPIPVVPVPLLEPDPDVPLDLGRAIQVIYDRVAYDLRIDYNQEPPHPDLFEPEDKAWLENHLKGLSQD